MKKDNYKSNKGILSNNLQLYSLKMTRVPFLSFLKVQQKIQPSVIPQLSAKKCFRYVQYKITHFLYILNISGKRALPVLCHVIYF